MAPKIKAKQSAKAKAKAKAPVSAGARNGRAPRMPKKTNIANVYEADDDDQVMRRGHTLDSVETYEYQNGKIGQEDDEDIDSDEAFDESDEERFEHFKFFGSTKVDEAKAAVFLASFQCIIRAEHLNKRLLFLTMIGFIAFQQEIEKNR